MFEWILADAQRWGEALGEAVKARAELKIGPGVVRHPGGGGGPSGAQTSRQEINPTIDFEARGRDAWYIVLRLCSFVESGAAERNGIMRTLEKIGYIGASLLCGSLASAQQFVPIAPLPGDAETNVQGVSGDGAVVVGTSGSYESERAFCWTAEEGVVALEMFGADSSARAVSADGTTIVGVSDGLGVRWINGELEVLEAPEDYPYIYPASVSADGNVMAGRAFPPFGPFGIAMRWTPDEGVIDLGSLEPDDYPVAAYAISDDGLVIAGISEPEAFRWTETLGMVGLGFLPGFEDFSIATCISADGSVIGGQADIGFEPGYAATYWTEPTGWIEIPSIIPSASVANAVNGVSGDGSIMVGRNTGFDPPARQLFIWDEISGPRDLQEALEEEYGVDFQGWQLADLPPPYNNEGDVTGISSDGLAIVGVTINPDTLTKWGWIVLLEGEEIPGDVDGDGVVDVVDLLAVLAAWGPCEDCPEDLNGDGVVDVLDLLIVLANWS